MQSKQKHTTSTTNSTAANKLMAVDDEADITFTLKMMLKQSGFSLDVFNDPTTALFNFKPDYYKLILLEVKMPPMNGFELFEEIKKKDKHVKACFVTAYDLYLESVKQQFPNLNIDCYIRKPIDMDNLVKMINKELFD
jgi:two-component system, OmpR family, response regulator ChvI